MGEFAYCFPNICLLNDPCTGLWAGSDQLGRVFAIEGYDSPLLLCAQTNPFAQLYPCLQSSGGERCTKRVAKQAKYSDAETVVNM